MGAATVAADGSVYVGTVEGYLHAVDRDGGYAWGYTLPGPITGRAAIASTGNVLVPTARRIYALRPNGTEIWELATPGPIVGDVVRDGLGRFHVAAEDGRLLAISAAGAVVSSFGGRGGFSLLPVASPSGEIAAAHGDGRVLLVSAAGRARRFALPATPRQLVFCPGAPVCAIVGGSLFALPRADNAWQLHASGASANRDRLAVLGDERTLSVFSGPDRSPVFSLALPEAASAAPLVDERGRVFVPLASGALLGVSAQGRIESCTPIAHSALATPIWDGPRQRVLVTAAEGVLAAILAS